MGAAASGLVDIGSVRIDRALPPRERAAALGDALGDSRRFRSGNVPVTVSFSGDRTAEEAVGHYLAVRANARGAMPAGARQGCGGTL